MLPAFVRAAGQDAAQIVMAEAAAVAWWMEARAPAGEEKHAYIAIVEKTRDLKKFVTKQRALKLQRVPDRDLPKLFQDLNVPLRHFAEQCTMAFLFVAEDNTLMKMAVPAHWRAWFGSVECMEDSRAKAAAG